MESENNIQTTLSDSTTFIEQMTVGQLLDDRLFYIPSYQRGYRWNKQQIYDLCNDLLEFALKTNKQPGSFYSLQPLIVRKDKFVIDNGLRVAYEVIDGQQRLTTIFVLYRFLAKRQRYTDMQSVSADLSGKKLYHLFYATRESDFQVLEKSGFNDLLNSEINDIDIAHVSNAYYYMGQWLNGKKNDDPECAESTYSLFRTDFTQKTVVEKLFDLLNDRDITNIGSVQFVWYEIDLGKDAIKEFLTENKGKIKLTDTEKIRALFMQRSNFENDVKNLKQLSIAKDWELVENTLHRNDFWSFISKDTFMEDGRISIIFNFIFDNDSSNTNNPKEGDYLFRYYYQHLAKRKNTVQATAEDIDNKTEIKNEVDELWGKVMDCFRMLQNWYYNPKIYNLTGLLAKHGYSIKMISDIYNRENVNTNNDFIKELNKEICNKIINTIPIKKGDQELDIKDNEEYLDLFYCSKQKDMIHDLLRFVNIREMNKIIDNALADIEKEDDEKKRSDLSRNVRDVMSHIYRFPFEALDAFGWDIEHIDSATTNSLSNPKEQKDWLDLAEESLKYKLLGDEYYIKLKDLYNNSKTTDKEKEEVLKKMENRVHEIVEEDSSDRRKNWIGNLTLLDEGTNRSYKNKIFSWKRRILLKRIRAGVFVPICTQNVFNKTLFGCSSTNWKWSHEDKKAYHSYLLSEIQDFKKEYTFDDEATSGITNTIQKES